MPTDAPGYGIVISRNITAARARLRLKQSDISARMNALGFSWHAQTVGQVEKAARRVTAEEVLGLAYALETSVGVLMEPSADESHISLPSGRVVDSASASWSVRHFNDGTVTWNGNVPEFHEVTESRRNLNVLDAAIGPMARYGRYQPFDKESLQRTSGVPTWIAGPDRPGDTEDDEQ